MTQLDHASTIAAPGYARSAAPRRTGRSRGRQMQIALGALAVLAVLAIGLRWTGAWDRLWGVSSLAGDIYVVRPIDMNITLTESGELKPVKSIDVKCEMDGFQNTILYVIEESSKVKKGDLLVEFASDKLKEDELTEESALSRIESELAAATQDLDIQRNQNQSDIEKADSDVKIAELELEKYTNGDYQQKLTTAKLDIKQANLDIEKRREELEKSRRLEEKEFITKTRIKELEFELERANMTLQKAELALTILETYEKPKELLAKETARDQAVQEAERVRAQAESRERQAVAKLKDAQSRKALSESRLARIRGELGKCRIVSPADGVVQYASGDGWRDDDRIAAGQSVRKGQVILQLPDTSQMMVNTRIHEADRHMVDIGTPCLVKVPAVPGSTFRGKLTRMAQYADSAHRWMNPDLKEHSAEILLDDSNAPVSPGDTAEVTILIGELKGTLAVPVISVFTRGAHSFVFVQRGGEATLTEIQIGPSNTTMVQVTDGLSEGDRVLMHVTDELLAKLPRVEMTEQEQKPAEEGPNPQARSMGGAPPGGAPQPGGAAPSGGSGRRGGGGGGRSGGRRPGG